MLIEEQMHTSSSTQRDLLPPSLLSIHTPMYKVPWSRTELIVEHPVGIQRAGNLPGVRVLLEGKTLPHKHSTSWHMLDTPSLPGVGTFPGPTAD